MGYSLPSWASISPDIPSSPVALSISHLANLGGGDALVVAIVPLTDILSDLNLGTTLETLALTLSVSRPGKRFIKSNVE